MSNIDWTQLVTKAESDRQAAERALAEVLQEISKRRVAADYAIAPLQDAVDLDDATDAEVAALKAWKKYRVALSRVPDQAGYPDAIDWPVSPA